MSSIHFAATPRKPIDIGDGLVMRWSTKADTKNVEERVSDAFKWMSFGGPPPEPGVIPGPNKYLKDAARRMFSGKNAVMSEFDYALVEDTKRAPGKNPIVACLALHRVRAYYGCVDDLFFGRPDVIATDPEYRNRGLVRKLLFEMIHPESEARGDALQFIGGLKHFYRQFGYEYAICSYSAATINDTRSIPALEEGKTEEPYVLREATEDDIPFLLRLSAKEKASPHTSVGLLYGPEYWQFTLRGFFEVMEDEWDEARDTRIIVDAATGKDVGFTIVAHPFNNKVEAIVIDETEARWHEVLLPVLRGIVTIEKGYLAEVKVKLEETEPKIAQAINTESFVLSLVFHHDHPATRLLDTLLTPAPDCPEIRLYVRINDYPVYSKRKLQLHFFRKVEGNKAKGLEIKFLKGKLVEVKDWVKPSPEEEVAEYLEVKARGEETPMIYEASFAPLTFHCLLMGERSLQDLIWSHGETSYKNDATKLLINTLFPRAASISISINKKKTNIHAAATSRTPIDLGNGLIMRWSTKADTKNIQDLVGDAFRWLIFGEPLPPDETPGPNKVLQAGVRRMMTGKNGAMSEFDFALVEDSQREEGKNSIVACVCLHRVHAYYGSVKLFFGEPEVIATSPEYRNRGLIRKLLLDMIHPESEARGDALQFIPGVLHFYCQFGYEYALSLFGASTIKSIQSLPSLEKGKIEPFALRKAAATDIPYLVNMSTKENVSPYTSVGLLYGPEYWKYTVEDYPEIKENEYDIERDTLLIADAATGKDVGFVVLSYIFGLKLEVLVLDKKEALLHDALFSVLRGIVASEKARLEDKKAKNADLESAKTIDTDSFPMLLQIHPDHLASAILDSLLTPPPNEPGYRIHVRINDCPQLICTVTPELERRLADSPMAGLSGMLRLDFFRKVEGNNAKGLEIEFKKGRLVDVKEWAKQTPEKDVEEYLALKAQGEEDKIPTVYEASFAPLAFNNLLIGERSLQYLIWSHGETTYKDDSTKLLINTLFPKGSQHIDIFFW